MPQSQHLPSNINRSQANAGSLERIRKVTVSSHKHRMSLRLILPLSRALAYIGVHFQSASSIGGRPQPQAASPKCHASLSQPNSLPLFQPRGFQRVLRGAAGLDRLNMIRTSATGLAVPLPRLAGLEARKHGVLLSLRKACLSKLIECSTQNSQSVLGRLQYHLLKLKKCGAVYSVSKNESDG